MLTAELLSTRAWRLSRADGTVLAPALRFLADGTVAGHDSPFEARWTLAEGSLCLRMSDGTETTRFAANAQSHAERPRFTGAFQLLPEADITHVLEPADGAAPPGSAGQLHAGVTLGAAKNILFASFNCLSRPFDGSSARFEFFELPRRLNIDHARFAERVPPALWYLDKTIDITRLLSGLLAGGYRLVVMCGMSSGGYASLLFAELLAPHFPRTTFRTFTINPQTVHDAASRAFMLTLPAGYPPALLDEAGLARRDIGETDIAIIARQSRFRDNVRHEIFFDPGNPAEEYYAGHLAGLSGVTLRPVPMAVGHLSGCIAMFEKGVAHAALEQACLDFS